MVWEKGQIAMEYFILTAFILVTVSVIFAFSFLNYEQNMKIVTANETLSKLANAVDTVYLMGKGNVRFVNISLPGGLEGIDIMHRCGFPPPQQGNLSQCKDAFGGPASYDDVNFSIIRMQVSLLGGSSAMMKETRAKVLEQLGEIALPSYAGSAYTVMVGWTDTGLIKLEKV